MVTSTCCWMRENIARRLEDGAKGNTGKTGADEVVAGGGGGVGAAGDVLLAVLVEQILDTDSDEDGDWREVRNRASKYIG